MLIKQSDDDRFFIVLYVLCTTLYYIFRYFYQENKNFIKVRKKLKTILMVYKYFKKDYNIIIMLSYLENAINNMM